MVWKQTILCKRKNKKSAFLQAQIIRQTELEARVKSQHSIFIPETQHLKVIKQGIC